MINNKIDNKEDLGAQIRVVLQLTFQVPAEVITDETRRGDLERWDSLGHLTLIEALRQQFGVEIAPEQALEMETVQDIKRIIAGLHSAMER
jgi:acyl carrier protein